MAKFPVFFPDSREFALETGSLETASSSEESCELPIGNRRRAPNSALCARLQSPSAGQDPQDSAPPGLQVTLVALPRNHREHSARGLT